MTAQDLGTFTRSYIETALWCTSIEEGFATYWSAKYGEDFAPDTSMESFGFTIVDLDSSARLTMAQDCEAFQTANADDLADCDATRAGHDFWLTRNRHGAGFWDGDYPADIGARLTDASHAYGEQDLYLCDDERIYST